MRLINSPAPASFVRVLSFLTALGMMRVLVGWLAGWLTSKGLAG